MVRSQCFGSLQLNNQPAIDDQIGEIVTNLCSVLVINLQRTLLLHIKPSLSQPMSQRIFIYFLKVTMRMVFMNGICRFPNLIT